VVAGVNDFIVCINETGMNRKLTFPSTMLMQNTNDMGNILRQRSSGSTTINGLIFRTLITTYAPMDEHMKWMQDTVSGNLKSSFCEKKQFQIRRPLMTPITIKRTPVLVHKHLS
jgi:phosphatidylinositol kinase/protein kinase (PI-3  family)